jgi:hypothetical protein
MFLTVMLIWWAVGFIFTLPAMILEQRRVGYPNFTVGDLFVALAVSFVMGPIAIIVLIVIVMSSSELMNVTLFRVTKGRK